jgi:hypothetical protein
MSLINDALRRASQSEKDRPRRVPAPTGMEPTPKPRGSRLSLLLGVVVLVALLLAGWFFWQWWIARNISGTGAMAPTIPPPARASAIPPPVEAPKPAHVAPIEPTNPVPAPVVVAPAALAAAPPVVVPSGLPSVPSYSPSPWPVELKLGGIFFSKTKPRVLINGNIYGPGDDIQGVVLKKIEPDKVTLEWNGHSRILVMEVQ